MKRMSLRLPFAALLAVVINLICISCGSTRKIAAETMARHLETAVNADRHEQTLKNEAVNEHTTETDFSTAVIEFTKIEYSDGISIDCACTHAASDTSQNAGTSSSVRPPNVGENVKSVTQGKITLNNDKTKQTDKTVENSEATQINESVSDESAEDNAVESKTEEKDKRGFIYYLGIIIGAVIIAFAVYCIVYGIWRIRKQTENRFPK